MFRNPRVCIHDMASLSMDTLRMGKTFKEGRSYFESGSPIDSSPRVLDRQIFEGQLLDDGSSGGTYVKGGDDTGNFKREGAASFVHSPRMTDELSEWVT